MNKEQIKLLSLPVLKKYGVLKGALFGSIVRGDSTRESDVDLLVEFEEGRSLLDLIGIKLELEELLNMKVDVVTFEALHPLLRDAILSEQEKFYEAPAARLS